MRNDGLITNDHILGIQAELEHNSAALGKVRMAIIHGDLRSVKDGRQRRILPQWVDEYVALRVAESDQDLA